MIPKVVLVVDADSSHSRALAEILRGMGCDVLTSPDGNGGWRSFLLKRPDIVLLDLLLPDMSGVDLAEKISNHGEIDAPVSIVLMTDLTLNPEWLIEPLKRGGISFTLSKPVTAEAALASLSALGDGIPAGEPRIDFPPLTTDPTGTSSGEVLESAASSPEGQPGDITSPDAGEAPSQPEPAPVVVEPDVFVAFPAATPRPSPRRVLLADDNPVTRQIFRRSFNSGEFLVETAADGEEASRLLEGEPPDIILLDVNLSGKNGFDLLDVIRSNDALTRAAVVFLREPFEKTDERRLKDSAADGLIQKPLKSVEWVERVRDILEAKTGRSRR